MAGLRTLIDGGVTVMAPGVGDALAARVVAEAGFGAVYMSGYQVAATLGYPDVGLVTMSEMAERAASICEAVELPVITDADTGYGNPVNVTRTVRTFERAGVAALHLEDQAFPKKCGAMPGRRLVPVEEMVGKVRAALDARRSSDLMIIARTDAITTEGLDAAIRRAQAYESAGADAVMVMAPRTAADLRDFGRAMKAPCAVTMGSWDFECSAAELRDFGYGIILYPVSLMRRAVVVWRELLKQLQTTGRMDHGRPSMIPMEELHTLLGLERLRQIETAYTG